MNSNHPRSKRISLGVLTMFSSSRKSCGKFIPSEGGLALFNREVSLLMYRIIGGF